MSNSCCNECTEYDGRVIRLMQKIDYGYISPLASMLLNASDQEFEQLRDGQKNIQACPGAAAKFMPCIGKLSQVKSDSGDILMTVVDVRHYDTFAAFLEAEGYEAVAPHHGSLQAALAHYHKFRSDEEIEDLGGICAVELAEPIAA